MGSGDSSEHDPSNTDKLAVSRAQNEELTTLNQGLTAKVSSLRKTLEKQTERVGENVANELRTSVWF